MSSMKISDFSINVPAKWVLTGEHSVLRGKEAIAFPYPEFSLSLSYRSVPLSKTLTITANPFQSQIQALIKRALEWLHITLTITGEMAIQSTIPIGAGLGSSAALCVAISRLVIWKTESDLNQWIPLATHLEDVFHGKSSGMDVSVIALSEPILYSLKNRAAPLQERKHLPRFVLYDSGKRGQTRECIDKVKHWQEQNPHQISRYDEQMSEATQLAKVALSQFLQHPSDAEAHLAQAINQAQNCFEVWGLVSSELMEQKHELLKQGALAVKLTGAGLGGFWVALWPSQDEFDKVRSNPIF